MKVRDLISMLEEMDEDTEVLIAHQPSWPLQEIVQGVVSLAELREEQELEDDDEEPQTDVVYLVAGGHPYGASPYAPKEVFDA